MANAANLAKPNATPHAPHAASAPTTTRTTASVPSRCVPPQRSAGCADKEHVPTTRGLPTTSSLATQQARYLQHTGLATADAATNPHHNAPQARRRTQTTKPHQPHPPRTTTHHNAPQPVPRQSCKQHDATPRHANNNTTEVASSAPAPRTPSFFAAVGKPPPCAIVEDAPAKRTGLL